MKNKNLWITLGIIWILFIVWEIYTEIWVANQTGPVIRIDLILFIPILAVASGVILFKIFRNNRNKKAGS
jgi:hypothetical protein